MGCISSKLIIARSISFHEERRKRSQRLANNIPFLEDLIISTVSNKLHSENIEKLVPSEKLGQEEGKENQFESDHKNRSKSWHCFPDDIVSSHAQENVSGFEDKPDLSSKGGLGSRSFHTVEEYDDMVNRIWLTKSHIVQKSELNNEYDDGSVTNKYSLEEREIVKEINIIQNEEVDPSHETKMLESDSEGVSSNIEKGNKRKAIAKKLESLRIPYNIECSAIASVKEWLTTDGIYSAGSYVTPKFGSYSSLMNIGNEKESSEDCVFSPELVSAFEQCMQKLEAEEENILKQIIEDVEEETDE